MGSDTEDVIDKLFNTLLQRFKCPPETSNERGIEFIPDSVQLYYMIIFKELTLEELNHT